MSRSSLLRGIQYLDIEEKILNIGALIALIGVFFPWFGGEWFGEPKVWSGFGFYTSFVGLLIFLSQAFVISLTVLPMFGYQVLRSSIRDHIRLIVGLESVLLVIVALSIYTNISFDFAQVGVYFGIYLTLVGSIIESLYAFLRIQQKRRKEVQELFHHPEDASAPVQAQRPEVPVAKTTEAPVPPPPPLPQSVDERLFTV